MKRFVLALTVALTMTAMLAASAVPALASPLARGSDGGFGLDDCSYLRGTLSMDIDGNIVCKLSDPYAVSY